MENFCHVAVTKGKPSNLDDLFLCDCVHGQKLTSDLFLLFLELIQTLNDPSEVTRNQLQEPDSTQGAYFLQEGNMKATEN